MALFRQVCPSFSARSARVLSGCLPCLAFIGIGLAGCAAPDRMGKGPSPDRLEPAGSAAISATASAIERPSEGAPADPVTSLATGNDAASLKLQAAMRSLDPALRTQAMASWIRLETAHFSVVSGADGPPFVSKLRHHLPISSKARSTK